MANANIFAQYSKPLRSVSEYAQEYDAAENNQLALTGKRMQIQAARMEQDQDSAFQDIARQYGSDKNVLAKKAYERGLYKQGATVEKQIGEQEKVKADLAKSDSDLQTAGVTRRKTEQDMQSKQLEDAGRRMDLAGNVFGFVKDNPTAENAIRAADFLGRNGIWKPEEVQAAIARVQADPSPQAIQALATQAYQGALDAKDQLPKYFNQNRGGTQAIVGVNPVSGAATDAQSAVVTQSEPQRLQLEQQARESALSRGVQIRGQNMVDARSRETASRADGVAVTDAGGPSQAAFTKQFGKAQPGYRWKADGNAEAIPGGPADLKNNAGTVAKVTDAQDVLSLLDQAEPLLDKSTGSYLGAAVDEAGRAVGGATGGAKAAAQLRALEGALISKMPKMSGPQSDKDVLLYKQMAGQIGDRTIPAEQKRAAMQTIREINSRHAGGAAKPTGAMSPEDTQAMEWANKNPNDPRAKQIKQRLGGG